ncbi:MAG: radical SAM protein [Bacteroidia bacterium]
MTTRAKKILLFNPRSANSKYRIPNSILSIASSIEGQWEWTLVDGNLESDPLQKLREFLLTGDYGFFGSTVMPGPQLKQAIPFTKHIKQEFPQVKTIWGGYFPSNHPQVVLESGFVDVLVYGLGEESFPPLLEALHTGAALNEIPNLIYPENGEMVKTRKADIPNPGKLPPLPYDKLDEFYPLEKYLGNTFLGNRTVAYHSSYGCPFTCSFCAVVPIFGARWKGKPAQKIYEDICYLKQYYGADAIEFHDNNFFVSEKRTVEFAHLIEKEQMQWWGEARIDTMDKYTDESLQQVSDAGCRMIFFGAETGDDAVLQKMNKGGTQTGAQILRFAERLSHFNIIPEYSFVLGTPFPTERQVWEQIEKDIAFIKKVKAVNPQTEIIIYIYSPVPTTGSDLFDEVSSSGFLFPQKLEDWISPAWENFDLRKNPLTPWLTPAMVNRIRNFEVVLNAQYPTVSDVKLTGLQRKVMQGLSKWRYENSWYHWPLELRVLQSKWLRYRQPEIEGM